MMRVTKDKGQIIYDDKELEHGSENLHIQKC